MNGTSLNSSSNKVEPLRSNCSDNTFKCSEIQDSAGNHNIIPQRTDNEKDKNIDAETQPNNKKDDLKTQFTTEKNMLDSSKGFSSSLDLNTVKKLSEDDNRNLKTGMQTNANTPTQTLSMVTGSSSELKSANYVPTNDFGTHNTATDIPSNTIHSTLPEKNQVEKAGIKNQIFQENSKTQALSAPSERSSKKPITEQMTKYFSPQYNSLNKKLNDYQMETIPGTNENALTTGASVSLKEKESFPSVSRKGQHAKETDQDEKNKSFDPLQFRTTFSSNTNVDQSKTDKQLSENENTINQTIKKAELTGESTTASYSDRPSTTVGITTVSSIKTMEVQSKSTTEQRETKDGRNFQTDASIEKTSSQKMISEMKALNVATNNFYTSHTKAILDHTSDLQKTTMHDIFNNQHQSTSLVISTISFKPSEPILENNKHKTVHNLPEHNNLNEDEKRNQKLAKWQMAEFTHKTDSISKRNNTDPVSDYTTSMPAVQMTSESNLKGKNDLPSQNNIGEIKSSSLAIPKYEVPKTNTYNEPKSENIKRSDNDPDNRILSDTAENKTQSTSPENSSKRKNFDPLNLDTQLGTPADEGQIFHPMSFRNNPNILTNGSILTKLDNKNVMKTNEPNLLKNLPSNKSQSEMPKDKSRLSNPNGSDYATLNTTNEPNPRKTDNIFTDDPKKIKLSDATENYTNLSSSSRIKTPTTPVLEGMEGNIFVPVKTLHAVTKIHNFSDSSPEIKKENDISSDSTSTSITTSSPEIPVNNKLSDSQEPSNVSNTTTNTTSSDFPRKKLDPVDAYTVSRTTKHPLGSSTIHNGTNILPNILNLKEMTTISNMIPTEETTIGGGGEIKSDQRGSKSDNKLSSGNDDTKNATNANGTDYAALKTNEPKSQQRTSTLTSVENKILADPNDNKIISMTTVDFEGKIKTAKPSDKVTTSTSEGNTTKAGLQANDVQIFYPVKTLTSRTEKNNSGKNVPEFKSSSTNKPTSDNTFDSKLSGQAFTQKNDSSSTTMMPTNGSSISFMKKKYSDVDISLSNPAEATTKSINRKKLDPAETFIFKTTSNADIDMQITSSTNGQNKNLAASLGRLNVTKINSNKLNKNGLDLGNISDPSDSPTKGENNVNSDILKKTLDPDDTQTESKSKVTVEQTVNTTTPKNSNDSDPTGIKLSNELNPGNGNGTEKIDNITKKIISILTEPVTSSTTITYDKIRNIDTTSAIEPKKGDLFFPVKTLKFEKGKNNSGLKKNDSDPTKSNIDSNFDDTGSRKGLNHTNKFNSALLGRNGVPNSNTFKNSSPFSDPSKTTSESNNDRITAGRRQKIDPLKTYTLLGTSILEESTTQSFNTLTDTNRKLSLSNEHTVSDHTEKKSNGGFNINSSNNSPNVAETHQTNNPNSRLSESLQSMGPNSSKSKSDLERKLAPVDGNNFIPDQGTSTKGMQINGLPGIKSSELKKGSNSGVNENGYNNRIGSSVSPTNSFGQKSNTNSASRQPENVVLGTNGMNSQTNINNGKIKKNQPAKNVHMTFENQEISISNSLLQHEVYKMLGNKSNIVSNGTDVLNNSGLQEKNKISRQLVSKGGDDESNKLNRDLVDLNGTQTIQGNRGFDNGSKNISTIDSLIKPLESKSSEKELLKAPDESNQTGKISERGQTNNQEIYICINTDL